MEHTIRLREGEVNLLGGMLEDQDTKAISGIPGLSQIPILKYLFSQTNVEHRENEIVFALIPHIVREHEVSDLNERALMIGTANTIELSHVSRPAGSSQAAMAAGVPSNAAPAPQAVQPAAQTPVASAPTMIPGQPVQQAPANSAAAPQAVTPEAQSPAGAMAQPGNASFMFDPATVSAKAGSTFTVNILLNGAQNVYSVPLQVSYDPQALQMVNISNGGMLSQDGQAVALVHRDDEQSGVLQITATRPPGAGGVSGQGAVVTLTFMAKAPGQSTLTISKGGARDPGMQSIPVAGAVASVNIQ